MLEEKEWQTMWQNPDAKNFARGFYEIYDAEIAPQLEQMISSCHIALKQSGPEASKKADIIWQKYVQLKEDSRRRKELIFQSE